MRIFPEMWANTLCPFSSWTRNIAFGSGWRTGPPSRIAVSLGLGRFGLLDGTSWKSWCSPGARQRRQPSQGTLYGTSAGNGKHLRAVVGDGDGVLEVGRQAPVGRLHGPAVVEEDGAGTPGVHHGLHGEDVAHSELDAPARGPVVGNLGLLMHGRPDPVADVLANDGVAGPLGHRLHSVADVGEPVAVADLGDGGLQALVGDLHQAAGVFAHLAHRDGDRRVAVVALDDGPAIEGEDVALLAPVVAGDAVHDHVVGRRADDGREAVVVEEVGAGATTVEHFARNLVEVGGGHAWLGGGNALLVHLGHDAAGPAHLGQLLDAPTHRGLSASGGPW